jgi:AAA family ATP:ADP antiporter
MIFDNDQEVTTVAYRYILKNHINDTVDLFNKYLSSQDNTIANAALIGLSLELRNNKKLQNRFNLENKIEIALEQMGNLTSKEDQNNKAKAVIEAVGNAKVERFYFIIKEYLASKDSELLNSAISSASNSLDSQFIDLIIAELSKKDSRQTAIDALFNYGEPIIKILSDKIKLETIDLEDAVFSILVIEKFASQKAINALVNLTDGTEHLVKMEAIDAIKRLKWKYTYLKIRDRFVIDKVLDECQLYQDTLSVIHSQIVIQYKKNSQNPETVEVGEARRGLIHLLEQRLDRQLQRIFKFLGIKYPPNDIDPILNSILYGKEEQRIHAIEFLDNILNNQLKKELIPVAESVLLDMFSEEKIKKLNLKVYSEEECFNELLIRKDTKLKLAVLYLIEQSRDKKFIPILEKANRDLNQKIQTRSKEILHQLHQ